MDRRDWLRTSSTLAASLALPPLQAAPHRPNTLHWAFRVAETGFDPPQVGDNNSVWIVASIFETPLAYDYLARPVKLKPRTAAALPEISSDFKTFTFRIRPGIFFADDPAFGGKPRELVAQDYVYSIKRYYDPRVNSEHLYIFRNARVLGLEALRDEAVKTKRPFDYDREVEGLRALDRYTFRVTLAEPSPRFDHVFANPQFTSALAREVVEAYGADTAAHPVGTGPFRLAEWRRASRIVLERNPAFRGESFDAEPAAGDAEGERIARQLAGKRLPLLDRIEISVIVEAQPRWLAFLDGTLDVLELPQDFTPIAVPNGRLAPHLARKGVHAQTQLQPDMWMNFFNMQHPLVGGTAPEKVALRRAISLAVDVPERLRAISHGQGIPAQSVIAPFTSGYDPDYRSTMSEHSVPRAMALLDMYGYIDRDGDGWREQPDGRPLVLRLASLPDQRSRAINDLWRKHMSRVGLRMEFQIANWPDLLKMSLAGSLMMWGFIWMASSPDGDFFLAIGYSPNIDESNDARFSLPDYDRLYEKQRVMPDGPEREAVMREAKNLLAAYMPYKVHSHTIVTDVMQPWVVGYLRHPFARDGWRYVGIAPSPA